ncbi:MAG: DNA-binding response regulator [Bacteroidetes bacterium HGW-Bacteroidetes-21]|jgi:two-component system LytT family response regulator|nr:MAG: DNA-binding response regulator [Bacteroidetes bacterium HGW-Bacteroidetes-21]
MALRCIIVDDESQARQNIKLNLQLFESQIEVIAEASDYSTAIEFIQKHNPDLVFLDIDLGGKTGFDVLQNFPDPGFQVIFVTAFSHHAINAFRVSAVDYLLKPVDPLLLKPAIEKAIDNILNKKPLLEIKNLLSNYAQPHKKNNRIVLHTAENIQVVEISNIIRCEASSNYTLFYLTNNTKILVSKTLKDYEDSLSDYQFIRSHQSHLVNLLHVKSFEKRDGGSLLMSDHSLIPVSSRKREQVLENISQLGVK